MSGVREGDGAGVSDAALRRLAEEMPCTCPTGEDVHDPERYVNCARRRAFDMLRRVATEAARLERERIEGIVREYLTGIYIVSKSGTHIASGCDEILRRIKGGE